MRILIVNDYGTRTGGAETMCLMERDELRRRGHEARFFASSAQPLGAPVAADATGLGTTSRWRTLLQSANPWAARRLREEMERFQPDIVHVRMFLTQLSPLILPALRDVPSLLHVADYRPICPISIKQKPDGAACHDRPGAVCHRDGCIPLRDAIPLRAQMALWSRWRDVFDAVVANSHWVADRLRAEGLEVTQTIQNGVPTRPQRPPLASPPTVAFAGRLVSNKGVGVLLEAFAQVARVLPDARLVIAGDGPEREALAQRSRQRELAGHVEWLGHLSRDDAETAFAPAWVQAVPSTWEEPFGLVAAEGLMRGTAVVASALGGLTEIVTDGETGALVPPGDPDALATACLDILTDRDRAEAMGRAGRARALDRFTETRLVDEFEALYHQLVHGSAAKHHPTLSSPEPVA
ncbi:MAG: glycosyltransferase family 4 protein [Bacteroidota bacterium]